MRFGGLNVVYDEDGNTYPMDDDVGQLYIPFEAAQTIAYGENEEETEIK